MDKPKKKVKFLEGDDKAGWDKYVRYIKKHQSVCSRIDAYKESKSAADAESLVLHLQSLVIPGEVTDDTRPR